LQSNGDLPTGYEAHHLDEVDSRFQENLSVGVFNSDISNSIRQESDRRQTDTMARKFLKKGGPLNPNSVKF
jgi:hypothetical protein